MSSVPSGIITGIVQRQDDISLWSEQRVVQWLQELGLEQYAQTFIDNRISGDVLLELNYTSLRDMGIRIVGDSARILQSLRRHQQQQHSLQLQLLQKQRSGNNTTAGLTSSGNTNPAAALSSIVTSEPCVNTLSKKEICTSGKSANASPPLSMRHPLNLNQYYINPQQQSIHSNSKLQSNLHLQMNSPPLLHQQPHPSSFSNLTNSLNSASTSPSIPSASASTPSPYFSFHPVLPLSTASVSVGSVSGPHEAHHYHHNPNFLQNSPHSNHALHLGHPNQQNQQMQFLQQQQQQVVPRPRRAGSLSNQNDHRKMLNSTAILTSGSTISKKLTSNSINTSTTNLTLNSSVSKKTGSALSAPLSSSVDIWPEYNATHAPLSRTESSHLSEGLTNENYNQSVVIGRPDQTSPKRDLTSPVLGSGWRSDFSNVSNSPYVESHSFQQQSMYSGTNRSGTSNTYSDNQPSIASNPCIRLRPSVSPMPMSSGLPHMKGNLQILPRSSSMKNVDDSVNNDEGSTLYSDSASPLYQLLMQPKPFLSQGGFSQGSSKDSKDQKDNSIVTLMEETHSLHQQLIHAGLAPSEPVKTVDEHADFMDMRDIRESYIRVFDMKNQKHIIRVSDLNDPRVIRDRILSKFNISDLRERSMYALYIYDLASSNREHMVLLDDAELYAICQSDNEHRGQIILRKRSTHALNLGLPASVENERSMSKLTKFFGVPAPIVSGAQMASPHRKLAMRSKRPDPLDDLSVRRRPSGTSNYMDRVLENHTYTKNMHFPPRSGYSGNTPHSKPPHNQPQLAPFNHTVAQQGSANRADGFSGGKGVKRGSIRNSGNNSKPRKASFFAERPSDEMIVDQLEHFFPGLKQTALGKNVEIRSHQQPLSAGSGSFVSLLSPKEGQTEAYRGDKNPLRATAVANADLERDREAKLDSTHSLHQEPLVSIDSIRGIAQAAIINKRNSQVPWGSAVLMQRMSRLTQLGPVGPHTGDLNHSSQSGGELGLNRSMSSTGASYRVRPGIDFSTGTKLSTSQGGGENSNFSSKGLDTSLGHSSNFSLPRFQFQTPLLEEFLEMGSETTVEIPLSEFESAWIERAKRVSTITEKELFDDDGLDYFESMSTIDNDPTPRNSDTIGINSVKVQANELKPVITTVPLRPSAEDGPVTAGFKNDTALGQVLNPPPVSVRQSILFAKARPQTVDNRFATSLAISDLSSSVISEDDTVSGLTPPNSSTLAVIDLAKEKLAPVRWEQGQLIGQGAFGRVFHALDLDTGAIMAVKQVILGGDDNPQRMKQEDSLRREIELFKDLDHVNIVQYLGFEITNTAFNVFLEYVSGGSIAGCLAKCGKFDEHIVKNFTAQILCGIEYLHSKNIIHRDVKGANMLIDNEGRVKISDFGISKKNEYMAYQRMTRMSLQGSIYWMAPEVARGKGYSAKVDIWSLGCLVLEMLTGEHPWFKVPGNIIYLLGMGNSPPISDKVSADAKEFIQWALTVDAEKRPTASGLLCHFFVGDPDILMVDFNSWFKDRVLSITADGGSAYGDYDSDDSDNSEDSNSELSDEQEEDINDVDESVDTDGYDDNTVADDLIPKLTLETSMPNTVVYSSENLLKAQSSHDLSVDMDESIQDKDYWNNDPWNLKHEGGLGERTDTFPQLVEADTVLESKELGNLKPIDSDMNMGFSPRSTRPSHELG
ncbi:ATP binding [Batrachochytrium dendrobatidis]|nr:ATP binding [Batrachochytrium dendrobatidis]KAK5670263.1 ATP binding [Batrachochytrium dendrobatidis]